MLYSYKCESCKVVFPTNYKSKRFCDPCYRNRSREKAREYIKKHPRKLKPLENKNCELCGVDYKTKAPNQKFCSQECSKKFISFEYFRDNPDRFKRLKSGQSNRLLKLRMDIFDRDSFMCKYCGRSPQSEKVVLHVDHKIPKNLGGSDDYQNLITACSDCNLGKSDLLLTIWKDLKI